jgi:hypothetical protein
MTSTRRRDCLGRRKDGDKPAFVARRAAMVVVVVIAMVVVVLMVATSSGNAHRGA